MKLFIVIGSVPRSGANLLRKLIRPHSEATISTAELQYFKKLNLV